MTNLKKRERAKTNASLISMVQRFSDITIMFAGLWLVCEVSGLSFLYMHLLVALITLVVFQMLGGITDFYRSWRGVRAATEFALLLQNWTLSVIFSAGLVAFNNDFDTQLKIWLAWYGLTSIGLVVCRSCIRIGAGWLRNHGYNKRMVAVAVGIPVVSTLHSGIPELVEADKSGWLVPENDARALAQRLAAFSQLDSDELAPVVKRAREKVEHDFNQQVINRELASLLQAL